MGLSQTEPKAKEGNGKSDTRIQVQAGTTSRFADEPEIRRPLPINLYDHQTVAAATPAIVKTKEVIVQSIRKTWVQIQCEDDHSPPVFEDWIFPEAHPLKVRGTKFWILIRDPDAVKIWKDRQSVEITGNKVIID